jgi:hypothetical protein
MFPLISNITAMFRRISTGLRNCFNAIFRAPDGPKTEDLSEWPYPEGYPLDPPELALRLSISKPQYLPGEHIDAEVSIHNQTPHPVTLAYPHSILRSAKWRLAYPDREPMIVVMDETSGKPLPHWYNCLGYFFLRDYDHEKDFVTIEPGEIHTVTGVIPSQGLEPAHTYSMYIRDPMLSWWAYGRKSELLAPGEEECERIFQKTGRNPLTNFSTVVEPRKLGDIILSLGDPVVFSILNGDTVGEHDGE